MLADFGGRAKNRRITETRNGADEIVWQLDLNELERYASKIGTTVEALIVTNQTEVRVRRGQVYMAGGEVEYQYTRITRDTQDLELRATGFLNLFDKRYTDEERYFPPGTEATTIAATLIEESQAKDNGDFGVTIGTLATVGPHEKTFKAVKVKEAIQTAAQLFDFDFEFTPDKVFNTYISIGSQRPEMIFEYPGNITQLGSPKDGTNLVNHVDVLGSGSGTQGNVKQPVDDFISQANYRLREERVNYSDVEDLDALADYGQAYLDAWSTPLHVPDITVDGNVAPFVTDYGIGDWVVVRCRAYASMKSLNGLFRIEKREIAIDENDSETVTLYVTQ